MGFFRRNCENNIPEPEEGSCGCGCEISGPTGPQGCPGEPGPQGLTGATGPQGMTGPQGAQGATGPAGVHGIAGATGAAGPRGATGSTGAQGPTGLRGSTGPAGVRGVTGPAYQPDNLVAASTVCQILGAAEAVNFGKNVSVNGESITHADRCPDVFLKEPGLYIIYYYGEVKGASDAAYPLAVKAAIYQDSRKVPDSEFTFTLDCEGSSGCMRGSAILRVSAAVSGLPSIVRLVNETEGVTWNYAEVLIGRSF